MTEKIKDTEIEKEVTDNDVAKEAAEKALQDVGTVEGTDGLPVEDKTIKDLTPEEKAELIKKFNEDPENVGYIAANDKEVDEAYEKELEEQLNTLMEKYRTEDVVLAPANDNKNMVKYVLEFVKKHLLWEGSWWRTVITLTEKLEEYGKKAKEEGTELRVDFVTCYVLNKIFNEDTIRSDYDGALFMEKNLERLTYYGNRIALAYAYVTQFSKNIQTLQKAVLCLKSGLNVDVTLAELEGINIQDADDKSAEMVKKFKEDGIL